MRREWNMIITHGGAAHRDDMLAVAIALHLSPDATVVRRPPTPAELDDPAILVLDTGLQYDPEHSNFDHHASTDTTETTCTLTKFLDAIGRLRDARTWWPWLALTDAIDSHGPSAAAQWGVSRESLPAFASPVESALLRDFSSVECINHGDFMHTLLA